MFSYDFGQITGLPAISKGGSYWHTLCVAGASVFSVELTCMVKISLL